MIANQKVAQHKLSMLQLAEELRNASEACRIMGYSRSQFFEIKRLENRHKRMPELDKKAAEKGFELSEEQVRLLEKLNPEFAERHVESL